MKRRNFLKTSAVVAGLGLAGVPVAAGAAPPGPALPSLEAMRRIGRRYLDRYPDEMAAARRFQARIGDPERVDRAGLRRLLAHEVEQDLKRHDVVLVDGWVVPRTLARACAAVALA